MNKAFLLLSYVFVVTFFCSSVAAQKNYILSDGRCFQSKEFYPKFSWDITPMYYMFGDQSRVLSPDEVNFITRRTDFSCIEKSHGLKQLGAAELGAKHEVSALKKEKPEMKVLFYFNSAYAWPFTSYNKNFTKKNIDEHPELKKFLIKKKDSDELEDRNNIFYFDVLNPEFRTWWVNAVAKGVEFSNADGAFIDQMHGFYWLRNDKKTEVEQVMGEMITNLKAKLGPNKILLGNNAQAKNAQYVFPAVDAIMFEHYNDELLNKENLLKDWNDMLRIAKAGKISVFRVGVEYDPAVKENESYDKGTSLNERFEKLSKEKLEYYLACYLIGAQPYSYFQYGWGWTLASGSLVDYPEFQRPLGAPKEDYVRTSPTGWEFTREFEHASVWVNTATGKAKITWLK
jgi:hypothetical protein